MLERERVRMYVIREKIKELGELQTKLKRARKTTLPKAEWEALRSDILDSLSYKFNREMWDHSFAASLASTHKTEITACLNLYHEIRGSEYRHAAEGYWYEKTINAIRDELKNLPKV